MNNLIGFLERYFHMSLVHVWESGGDISGMHNKDTVSSTIVFLAGFWKKVSCADDTGQLPSTENRRADKLEPRASRGKRTGVLNSISVSRGGRG
jgi:hypothetical protein